MPITAVGRTQTGSAITFKASGGSAALTFASLANGSYRQSVKADFGATRARLYAVYLDIEHAATPTAGNLWKVWLNPSSSATAGTDNRGGCAGTDSAYTGYSSNAADSVKQMLFVGAAAVTVQATATVQRLFVGVTSVPRRYASAVVLNSAGSAVHSSDANCELRFEAIEDTSEPS